MKNEPAFNGYHAQAAAAAMAVNSGSSSPSSSAAYAAAAAFHPLFSSSMLSSIGTTGTSTSSSSTSSSPIKSSYMTNQQHVGVYAPYFWNFYRYDTYIYRKKICLIFLFDILTLCISFACCILCLFTHIQKNTLFCFVFFSSSFSNTAVIDSASSFFFIS